MNLCVKKSDTTKEHRTVLSLSHTVTHCEVYSEALTAIPAGQPLSLKFLNPKCRYRSSWWKVIHGKALCARLAVILRG